MSCGLLWAALGAPWALAQSAAPPPAQTLPLAQGSTSTFENFAGLRFAMLEFMAGATQRIWLCTDYLSDGEIATALYIAKYRKLDVRVLLGRSRAALYTSRLSYLKAQNISVFLKPDNFKTPAATMVLADERVALIDGELDSMAKYRRFALSLANAATAQNFAEGFAEAAKLELPATPRPLPLVGKSGAKGKNFGSDGAPSYNGRDHAGSSRGANDVYRYTTQNHEPRPAGVPNKLPRSTIMDQRGHLDSSDPAPPKLPEGALNP